MPNSDLLLVAPYRHTGALSAQVVAQLGLSIPVEVAYDYEALDVVKRHPKARIVISRGGTAKVLRGVPNLTVIDIEASFYDVFNAVKKLLLSGCHRIAVVTQDNVIGLEEGDLSLNGDEISVYPCRSPEEIEKRVEAEFAKGCDGIAGCVVAVNCARRLKMRSAFIDSDFFSIKKAVLNALELERSMSAREMMLSLMQSLFNNIDEGVVVFDEVGHERFFNDKASELLSCFKREHWLEKLNPLLKKDGIPATAVLGQRRVLMRNLELSSGDLKNRMVVIQDGSALEESVKSMKFDLYEKGLFARTHFSDILHKSRIMDELVEKARKFARSDSTVMIFGETGVGKEGFAQSIHNDSLRSDKPFVSVNCASLPEGLVASELFGYAEGAFTGARKNGRKGVFEMAQGGTIFLDEITELPLDVQSQLLRVIQEREVRRVGDDRVIPLDIRIICAGNRRILDMCSKGTFRFDLYYRLNVLRLSIPPLRERGEDVLLLFKRFMADFLHCSPEEILIDDGGMQLLCNYQWPGNVRELRNVAEALSFDGQRVSKNKLQELLSGTADDEPSQDAYTLEIPDHACLKELEGIYLKRLMKRHCLKDVCAISGLSRTTLWRKLKDLDC